MKLKTTQIEIPTISSSTYLIKFWKTGFVDARCLDVICFFWSHNWQKKGLFDWIDHKESTKRRNKRSWKHISYLSLFWKRIRQCICWKGKTLHGSISKVFCRMFTWADESILKQKPPTTRCSRKQCALNRWRAFVIYLPSVFRLGPFRAALKFAIWNLLGLRMIVKKR